MHLPIYLSVSYLTFTGVVALAVVLRSELLTKPDHVPPESSPEPQESLQEENTSTPKFGGEISQQNEDGRLITVLSVRLTNTPSQRWRQRYFTN
jgi:hypothetical protein